jgi:hypothetical protein
MNNRLLYTSRPCRVKKEKDAILLGSLRTGALNDENVTVYFTLLISK